MLHKTIKVYEWYRIDEAIKNTLAQMSGSLVGRIEYGLKLVNVTHSILPDGDILVTIIADIVSEAKEADVIRKHNQNIERGAPLRDNIK